MVCRRDVVMGAKHGFSESLASGGSVRSMSDSRKHTGNCVLKRAADGSLCTRVQARNQLYSAVDADPQ